jgi:hypothetical protein
MALKRFGLVVAVALWVMALATRETAIAQRRSTERPEHAAVSAGTSFVSFETADRCIACHNGLTAPSGEDVSIGIAWRASMMANSSRDPYWQAAVRRETLDHPVRKAAIEDECAICHMPMARFQAHAAGREGEVFALSPALGGTSPEQRLAADGVSCMLCHQMAAEGLGTRESFIGRFAIAAPDGAGPAMVGPFEVDKGRTALMHSATGATPVKADHLKQSEICATCHTLYTQALGPNGDVIGELPEQMPYQEWRHSAFATERSCQSCHMPVVENTAIASVLGESRDRRIDRHTFLGGNFFMLRMLNRFRAELGVAAPPQELEASAQATVRQLQTDTATIAIARAARIDGRLEADVVVRNLTGHKLPTGYPSRRVWLHLTVRDSGGRILFESGRPTSDGGIEGNDNDADAGRFEPHYERIERAGEVQVYEAVMARPDGTVTTGLLQATQFIKDNRLLPRGFDKGAAGADIAVRGNAAADPDFNDSGDRVRYAVPLSGERGPLTLDVALHYQPIAFRWAANLRGYDAVEPRRFVSYFDAMAGSSSVALSRATATIAE